MTKWEWLKEKIVETLISTVMVGILAIAGFGLVEVYLSDYRREKLKDEIMKKLVDDHNETIKREGEVLEKMANLEHICGKQVEAIDNLQKKVAELKKLSLPVMAFPRPNFEEPVTDLQKLDQEAIKEINEWQKKPRLNPAQQRLDWQNKFEQKYDSVKKN